MLPLILILTVALGFIVRIYQIEKIPAGFFCDEASISYNAYSLLRTGKDEFGESFPILFQSFGNFRPGTSIYFSLPFIAILGMNEFSSRLPSVIIGTLGILIIFFLARELFNSMLVGLWSAIFFAISPWGIHFSRIGQENIYFPVFVSLSILLFLIGIKQKNRVSLIASLFCFGISLYTYVVAYFTVPLLILLITILYARKIWNMKYPFLLGILLFLFMTFPLMQGIPSGQTFARFQDAASVNQKKSTREFIEKTITTYRDHFSYNFLFKTGDIGYPTHFITRFSIQGFGQFYAFQFPIIVLGLTSVLFISKHKREKFLLLGWIIFYPLGSTALPFTDGGGPFATRSIIGVIPIQILSALGIVFLLESVKHFIYRKAVMGVLLIIMLFSFSSYLHRYFIEYPLYSSDFWGWQYGARDIVHYFVQHQYQYDDLIMAPEFNAPEIFFKFYAPNNCSKCRVGLPIDLYNPKRKQLFAVPPSYLSILSIRTDLKFKTIQTIRYPNKNIAFQIGEIIQ